MRNDQFAFVGERNVTYPRPLNRGGLFDWRLARGCTHPGDYQLIPQLKETASLIDGLIIFVR